MALRRGGKQEPGKVLPFVAKCDFCPRDAAAKCRRCGRRYCGVHNHGRICCDCDRELRPLLGPRYLVDGSLEEFLKDERAGRRAARLF